MIFVIILRVCSGCCVLSGSILTLKIAFYDDFKVETSDRYIYKEHYTYSVFNVAKINDCYRDAATHLRYNYAFKLHRTI